MEQQTAVKALSALAHDGRLSIFRHLIQAGAAGLAAGELARLMQAGNSTISAQLLVLANADLVLSARQGRSIIYSANFAAMEQLLRFLLHDCCGSESDICVPWLNGLTS